MAKQHFQMMMIGGLSICIAWWAPKKRIHKLISIKNKEVLTNLQHTKENTIFLAPHFVSLELLGMYFSSIMPLCIMPQKHKDKKTEALIEQRRSRFGACFFDYKNINKSLIKKIKSGTPIYYMPDQDPGQNTTLFADFFNIPTATYPTLGKLARITDAQVVPCMMRLKRYGRGFEIIFNESLKDYPTNDPLTDTNLMNQTIEKMIAHAPEQYFWSHKRFKTRPTGVASFYD